MPIRLLCLWVLFAASPVLLGAAEAPPVRVEEVLPGETADEIVLSAHCESVSLGCEVAAAAVADLRRTPLRHTVRVVFFDGEERGGRGSEGWLRDLDPGEGERVLANLNLEMRGGPGSQGPVVHIFPALASGRRVLAPGWLVHSVLRSGEAVGWPFAVADRRFPLLSQLIVRSVAVRHESGSELFLERGIPSVTLSDSSLLSLDSAAGRPGAGRLDRWTQGVAAAVRRLDALAGRPLPEDQYLVAAGRVWLRRDLIWMGFLLWGLLVFRGLPGRWRGASTAEHGRQMRAYLPGLLFRALLLASVFVAPVFAVLLFPAAALALVPPRPAWGRAVWIVLGVCPLLAFLAVLGIAVAKGAASLGGGFQGGAAAMILIPATLMAYGPTIVHHAPAGMRHE